MMSKKCSRCDKDLPISDFHKQKTGKLGVTSRCKACESKKKKVSYLEKTGKTEVKLHSHTIDICHKHAESHGGKCLSTEYVNMDTKYKWECGDCNHQWFASVPSTKDRWCPKCGRTKARETCLKKYGVDNPNKDPETRLRGIRKMTGCYILSHWKTTKDIVCQGSYERNVAEYLNLLKIDFDWQVPFTLSDGRTYIIDFYDKHRDVYVEVKGLWRDDAREKFDLFKGDNPSLSVEVWDKSILKQLGIKVRQ